MSNLYGYSVDNFMGQLPAVLFDDSRMSDLARSIAKVLAARLKELPLVEIYTRIDKLPEELLDILARDFSIDWYSYDYHIEAKRNLIKTNYYVHRHLGTRGAVKSAVVAVYPHSDVEEWFQYEGEPYHFRILLESGHPIVPISNTEVLRQVYLYKSMRSHLDGIIYRSAENLSIQSNYGWMTYWGRVCGIFPQRARLGVIEKTGIVVETDAQGIPYTNPNAGEIQSGVFPNPAAEGRIYAHTIGITGDAGGMAYRTPYTGEIHTGTFPQAARIGIISEETVTVETGADNVAYMNPSAGEIESGIFPETAIQGQISTETVGAGAGGEGTSYSGRICGSGMDSLF